MLNTVTQLPSNWHVSIPGLDELQLTIINYPIPSVDVQGTPVAYDGVEIDFDGGGIDYGRLIIQFIVSEGMANHRKMLDWIKRNKALPLPESTDIVLSITDDSGNLTNTGISFKDAIIKGLTELELTAVEEGTPQLTCTATLSYTEYDYIDFTEQ